MIKFEDFYFSCECTVYDMDTNKFIDADDAIRFSKLEVEKFKVHSDGYSISVKLYKDDLEED